VTGSARGRGLLECGLNAGWAALWSVVSYWSRVDVHQIKSTAGSDYIAVDVRRFWWLNARRRPNINNRHYAFVACVASRRYSPCVIFPRNAKTRFRIETYLLRATLGAIHDHSYHDKFLAKRKILS
jgi:hypothetical protein